MLDERDEFLLSRYADGELSVEEVARVEGLLAGSEEAREVLRQYRQLGGLMHLGRVTPRLDYDQLCERIMAGVDVAASGGGAGVDGAGVGDAGLGGAGQGGAGHELGRGLGGRVLRERSMGEGSSVGARQATGGSGDRAFWQLNPWSRHGVFNLSRGVAIAASLFLALGLSWQVFKSVPRYGNPAAVDPVEAAEPVSSGGVAQSGASAVDVPAGVLAVTGPAAQAAMGAALVNISVGPSATAANTPPAFFYDPQARSRPTRVAIDPDVTPASKDDTRSPF